MKKNFDFIKFFETFPVLVSEDYALNEKLRFSRICMDSVATFIKNSNFQQDTLLGYDPETGIVMAIKTGSSRTINTISNFFYEKVLGGYQYELVMRYDKIINSIPKITENSKPHSFFHVIPSSFGQINHNCTRLVMFHESNKEEELTFCDFEGLTERDFAKVEKPNFPGVYFCRNKEDFMGDHILFIGDNIRKIPLNSYKTLFKGKKVIARLMDQDKVKQLKTYYS